MAESDDLLREVMRMAQVAAVEFSDASLKVAVVRGGDAEAPPFGLGAAQVARGTSWYDNVYPSDRERLRAYSNRRGARSPGTIDYRLIVGEGELLWVRHRAIDRGASGATGQANPPGRALIMAIPEQKHLEWECLRVSERECNRIGQELHDDLCQVLAGLTFMMRVVSQRARRLDATLAAEIDELNTEVTGATDRVRSMAHGLFPAQLRYATLRHALTAFASETRTRFKVEIALRLPRKLPRHSAEQIIHVYRIVQEAVSNAVKHGAATAIEIALAPTSAGLVLTVEDDGKGFATATERPEGIGMHVMQYRARALGGALELRPISPRGIAVRLAYPIGPSAAYSASKHFYP